MSDHQHTEWLSLIEISGPFLAVPVLKEAFPQGLDQLNADKRKRIRQAYDEWREAIETKDPQLAALHRAWIEEVLCHGLELDDDGAGDVLKRSDAVPGALKISFPEHGVTLVPDYAVVNGQQDDKPLMLIRTYPEGTILDAPIKGDGWVSSPAERMVQLCRAADCRMGLITDGERWMLIDAPIGATTTFASWYARLWLQEPVTLQAFVALLGIRRFFLDDVEQLPALIDKSLQHQDEVTDALGEQVRRAVEVLVQALDRADLDRNRDLLRDVAPAELYEAGLTVMMRLVFLLCAEERGLLLLGNQSYEANYAVSTLRAQLRKDADEILERRWDAWSRLLAVFRAVYGGVEYENLRLPALGGSLFDPDRFPFLEGRAKGSNWKYDPAKPLPIDNRTVLLLLESIQMFQGRTLSYRALDVEQIGYVYEGLLERTVKRATEETLELKSTKNAEKPWVTLGELESAKLDGNDSLTKLLKERTGSKNRIVNDLKKDVSDEQADLLLTACNADQSLRDRIKPYFHLLRTDPWGYPLVYPKGAFMVTTGSDRRETGTHYTPKSLTEAIVKETLEPIVYIGPAEGKDRKDWALKSPAALLDLKICDMAMGSGAFLVQVCRWLSERLVESWLQAETAGKVVAADGKVLDSYGDKEPLPAGNEERLIIARRLIAERCLYGVDMNPLAVELAKLAIWLVTLAKDRPFGFLDHNLRHGDSLLGIKNIDQLTCLSLQPGKNETKQLFSQKIDHAVRHAMELRKRIRNHPIRDIHDVEVMTGLDTEARQDLAFSELIADALIGLTLDADGKNPDTVMLSIDAGEIANGNQDKAEKLKRKTYEFLRKDLPSEKNARKPFHWPLAFPEVFFRESSGFDAIVGNPPFVGGQLISGSMGKCYKEYLSRQEVIGKKAAVDLVVYFFIRAHSLIREQGILGLLARRSLAEGKNREVGLDELLSSGAVVFSAYTDMPWPGRASVVVHQVHIAKAGWHGNRALNGVIVSQISSYLGSMDQTKPNKIPENLGRIFQGTILLGEGFKISEAKANELINEDDKYEEVLFPFIGGNEVNKDPRYKASSWVINFWDWPMDKAQKYPAVYDIVDVNVRPGRGKNKDDVIKNNWWLHLRPRPELYHLIGRGHSFQKHPADWDQNSVRMKRVLVISTGVTKYPAFTFLTSKNIYSNKLCVLADDRYSMFAILSSDMHGVWAWAQKTSLGADLYSLVYAHGNIFETFPFPEGFFSGNDFIDLERIGEKFFSARQEYMISSNKGLTKFYNDFHNPKIQSEKILSIRKLQSEMNDAVMSCYGWQDIDLNSGFHQVGYLPEGSNTRYTISETARIEIIQRLAELNKTRSDGIEQLYVEDELSEDFFDEEELDRAAGGNG